MAHQTSINKVAILANPKAGDGKAIKTAHWLADSLNKLEITRYQRIKIVMTNASL